MNLQYLRKMSITTFFYITASIVMLATFASFITGTISIYDFWALSALCSFGYFVINADKSTHSKVEITLLAICGINFGVFCMIVMVAVLPAQ